MVKTSKMPGRSMGGVVLAVSAYYLGAFILLQYSGLLGPAPVGFMRVLHQWPALAGIAFILFGSIAELKAFFGRQSEEKKPDRIKLLMTVMFYAGLLIVGTGIFLSSLTRFEGRLTLSEGQDGNTAREGLDPSTAYARAFSLWPAGRILMDEIEPFHSENWKHFVRSRARVVVVDSKSLQGRELTLDSAFPKLINGFFYQLSSFGYSPHFRLFQSNGKIIEDVYIVMRIFPLGLEDSFRVTQIPHTFYLRYYPDVSLIQDRTGVPEGKNGPLYKVRAARNLDLILNTYASPEDLLNVDELAVSFGDVRSWAEISIVRDPGLYMIIPGFVMTVIGGFVLIIKRTRDKGEVNG